MELAGVIKEAALVRQGLDRRELDRMVRSGGYRRVGFGWLVAPEVSDSAALVLATGGRLSCVSGADLVGLWTPPFSGHHLYLRRGTATPDGYLAHRPAPRVWPDADPVAPLPLLLEHTVRCQGVETGAMVIESAWNQELVDTDDVDHLVSRFPAATRNSLGRLRADAQSGTETRVRWWLERQGVAVRAQVAVPEVGFVDLMLGRWVIECDSRAHHTGEAAYAEDRRRDLQLRRQGYLVTRLTWEQVFLRWEETQQTLLSILRTGEHRRNLLIA